MEVVRVGEWCLGAGSRRAGTGLLEARKMVSSNWWMVNRWMKPFDCAQGRILLVELSEL